MRAAAVALLALTSAGCGFKWDVVSPTDAVEGELLSETARFAGVLGVNVHGVITDELSKAQKLNEPVGFYDGGVAYYYRPNVEKYVGPGKVLSATDVAAHEVCHANHYLHDHAHWACSASIATPTYPEPK